jgi:hypothetical protein
MDLRSSRCLQRFEMTTKVSAQLPPRLSRGCAAQRSSRCLRHRRYDVAPRLLTVLCCNRDLVCQDICGE